MGAALGRLALTATLLVMLGGTAGRAASVLVIGDLPAANDGKFSAVASLGGTYSKAVGFTMPAESFDLASVTLRLREQPGSYNTLSVQLYGGNTNPSGQALVDFDTPTIPTQAGDVTFTPKTSFTLKGDTTYWLYLSGKSNTLNGIVWYASNPALLPTGIATSAGARFSNNQAGVISALTPSSVMNTFSVTGSFNGIASIPEPAGLIQAATAVLVGLAYAGWRARRARADTRMFHRADGASRFVVRLPGRGVGKLHEPADRPGRGTPGWTSGSWVLASRRAGVWGKLSGVA